MIARLGLRRVEVVVDPPEPWERPALARELSPIEGYGRRVPNPYRPGGPDEVPAGALEALRAACDVAGPSDLLVVPPAVRPTTDDGRAWVSAPTVVVGFGRACSGAWVDAGPDGGPGVRATIRYDHIAAIDDARVLLFGRVRLVAAESTISLRYNTVARGALEPLLLEVRRRAAGEPLGPAPSAVQRGSPAGARSAKWERIARSEAVLLEPGAPATVVFGEIVGATRRAHPQPALVALTARELVVASEPADAGLDAGYGVDVLAIPRCRIEAVRMRDGRLHVRAAGASLEVVLGPTLAAAARDGLGDLLGFA